MKELGNKIAAKRKALGIPQISLAEKLCVTRQTVSRWESGDVLPDIEKIPDIAEILGVSCDYLMKDDVSEEDLPVSTGVSRLLRDTAGRKCILEFFEDEGDYDLFGAVCTVIEFQGSWMKVGADTKKGHVEKLLPLSSIRSLQIVKEEE